MSGLYYDERGKEGKDGAEAAWYYTLACGGKQYEACQNLGYLYEKGKGVKQSFVRASSLYGEACGRNFGFACYRLGKLYSSGKGGNKSDGMGSYLKSLACRLGEVRACPEAEGGRPGSDEQAGKTHYGRTALVLP
jgi:TPR repeat protein